MSRRAWVQFGFLAAFWGASYLFIKVALEDVFEPPMIVFLRTALAAVVLVPFALRSGALGSLRGRLGVVTFLALLQVAAPFLLISFGQEHISSSLAGVLVATAPIFTFLLAIRISQEERVQGIGLVGVGLGLVGVVLLLGVDAGGGAAALAGGLMVVLASLGYALGAFYLKRTLSGIEPTAIVAVTMAASALIVAPFAAFSLPTESPSLEAVGSLTALGVLGTGISFVLYYDLVAAVGPAKASLVAYIAPGFAVIYGVALLDETFTAATAGGLLMIVGGSWLAAEGRLPWQPRRAKAAVPRSAAAEAARG